MNGTDYQLIVYVLIEIVLIYLKQMEEVRGTLRLTSLTPDKSKGFLVHLPSRVDYQSGNLV